MKYGNIRLRGMFPTLNDHTYPIGVLGENTFCVTGWFFSQGMDPNTIGMYNNTHVDVIEPLTFTFPLVFHFLCDFILSIVLCVALCYPCTFILGYKP